ncbi:MAG: tetratricopeptide repeat protein [Aquificaceae bacterium]|nr:tetratricopeptide repeat protein [Aquificaceae bacterium]MDW8237461.1 tetratricopeptide repeat protein [Aquificaceae bacterium]
MRLYFLIALFFVLPILIVSSFLAYNHFRKSTLENASYLEFRISQAVSKENKEAALKDISSAKVEPRTFRALINSYKLVLNKSDDPSSTLEDISDSELRSIYLERKAYYLFSQGKPKEALDVLNSIRRDSFNYQSSLLLKAQVLIALGDKQTATQTLEEIIKTKPDSYLANIAKLMRQEL